MRILLLVILLYCVNLSAQINSEDSQIINFISKREVRGNQLVRTDSLIIQINNRQGDENAQISIPYSKGDKLTIQEAYIQDTSGNVIYKIKNKDINDRSYISDMSLYEDDFIKYFDLKHNVYPYQIVYSYKITHPQFLQIANYNFNRSGQSIENGKLIVEVPVDRTIKYIDKYTDTLKIETIDNTISYCWEFHSDANSYERDMSYNTTRAAKITVVPFSFNYGKSGTWQSWETFGDWIYKLNEGRDLLPEIEKAKIVTLLQGVQDDKEKIRILYHYLQDYNRYINVSIGIGGLQTYSAEYVSKNRYGDCKALTNYMKAILKQAGIDSFYTLINSGDKVEYLDHQFAYQAFNHVVLTVPQPNDTIHLECTSQHLPFGYVHSDIQGRKALLTRENDSKLISIPSLTPDDVKCERKLTIDINLSVAKSIETLRGDPFLLANYLIKNNVKTKTDDHIRKSVVPNSLDLLDFEFTPPDRDDKSISFTINGTIRNSHKIYGSNLILTNIPRRLKSYETPDNRKQDLQIDYPTYYVDTIIYKLNNKNIKEVPKSFELKTPYGEYSYKYSMNDNELTLVKTILLSAGRYSLSDYKDFYTFVQAIINNENKNIYLELL